ncbi:MAG: SRPBCC family protein [Ilumatobacteraceae bacterium]
MSKTELVDAERIVHATPAAIFNVIADPRQHPIIDGSGTVRKTRGSVPARLSLGTKFGMDMKLGVPYPITNTVIEFDEGKQIAWRHFGGHIWRYILEPVADGTKVTEQFEYTHSKGKLLLHLTGTIAKNQKAMQNTLENLEKHFSSTQ